MTTRVVLEMVLTLAGWGFGIAAIVAFIAGQTSLGFGFVAAAVISFIISAASHRSKPTGDFISDGVGRVMKLLEKRRYPEAHQIAGELVSLTESNPPMTVIATTIRALTSALTGNLGESDAALLRAVRGLRNLPAYERESLEGMLDMQEIIADALSRGVIDRDRLADEFLSANQHT